MKKTLFTMVMMWLNLFPSLYAQDIKKDLDLIAGAYSNQKQISFNIFYEYFDGKNIARPKDTLAATMNMYEKDMNYKIGRTQLIRNSNYTLMIDHDFKSIMVEKTRRSSSDQTPAALLDSLIRYFGATVEFTGSSNGKKTYQINYGKGVLDKVDFTFSSKTNLLTEIIIFYNQSLKLRSDLSSSAIIKMTYRDYRMHSPVPELYSEKSYITFASNTPKLNKQFEEYQLINNLKR